MKGVALQTMIGLIVAILVGAVILLVLYSGNIISSFNEEFSLMITTLSAYFRIALVLIVNPLITVIATILLVIAILKMATGSYSGLKSAGGFIKGFVLPLGRFSTGMIAFMAFQMVVTTVLPAIPLYAPHININIGTTLHPEDNTTYVAGVIAEKIDNTWKAFGSGSGNPLEGTKNPYMYYTIFVHLDKDKTLDMGEVYTVLTKKYHSDYTVYLFCANSKGIIGSKNFGQQINPVCWRNVKCDDSIMHTLKLFGSSCTIKDGSEIKIYYLDHMDTFNIYASLYSISEPYGCPYVYGVGNFDRDSIIVCVT